MIKYVVLHVSISRFGTYTSNEFEGQLLKNPHNRLWVYTVCLIHVTSSMMSFGYMKRLWLLWFLIMYFWLSSRNIGVSNKELNNSDKPGFINLKPKPSEVIHVPSWNRVKAASSTKANYSIQTNATTKTSVFQEETQINMADVTWGHGPSQ